MEMALLAIIDSKIINGDVIIELNHVNLMKNNVLGTHVLCNIANEKQVLVKILNPTVSTITLYSNT